MPSSPPLLRCRLPVLASEPIVRAMKSDLDISRAHPLLPIRQVALKLGLQEGDFETYGRFKAKVLKKPQPGDPRGRLILVTAISPTPPGEGKTTLTIGLGDALNRIGKKTVICLREPSIGPTFGMKGGATGGGHAQVAPMEDINLHFTGDFHAIQLANNLLSAMIDNHLFHGNALNLDPRRITWRRVLDLNDRALREIVVGLGGAGNGYPRQDGFDIVVASEVMAILCLSTSMKDLRQRLGSIVVGETTDRKKIRAEDLQAAGAMAALLKDAFYPNLVQTLEGNPALIHGGPFANIAHGCNSVAATQLALGLGEYVVTEAGFGADLGAEKFINIKCRKSGLRPEAAVIVATLRALKYHGGVDLAELEKTNLLALKKGTENLRRHLSNLRSHFGLPCLVALNCFDSDTETEISALQELLAREGVQVIPTRHWALGSAGATELAQKVIQLVETQGSPAKLLYEDQLPLWNKIETIATCIYGASHVEAPPKVRSQLEQLERAGFGHYPVCIAKTQVSFSEDPAKRGAPTGHALTVREVRLAAGAEFIIAICGDILTMPGLPKNPAAMKIDLLPNGQVTGLN